MTYGFVNTHLTHLNGEISLDSFCPDGFVDIGVPIGTDAFTKASVFVRPLGYNILIHI